MAKVIVSVPSQSNTVIVSPILATPVVTSIPVDNLSDLNLTKSVVQPNQIMVYNGTSWIYDYGHDQKFYAEAYNELTFGVELYYTATADGDGYITQDLTATPAGGNEEQRRLYYKATAFGDSGTTAGYTDAGLATDATYAEMLVAFNNLLKTEGAPITVYATRAEVASAPSFTGLLNESYGSGAAAAYSVRRLNGNYTGAAIEVERSSDNTTQDIGFDSNGDLDESALTTFCTGTTCKVRTWYDQSQSGGTGSGNDAVQTTHANQPTIYTGGAIVKESGRPAADFDGTNDTLQTSNFASLIGAPNFFTGVVSFDDTADQYFIDSDSSGRSATGIVSGNYSIRGLNGGAAQAGKHLMTVSQESANAYLYVDGNQKISISNSTLVTHTNILISDDSLRMDGTIQELTLWSADKSTDRTSIEENVGDYFTQNTPLLDTYTGAAAAYSLRKLRTAYTGSAIRVRRSNDNAETDIGFNVFGELDTVSLAAHCGSNDGFVKTWYDQAGANDATQTTTTAQPKIYDSVAGVLTENGKPAVQFDGTDDGLDISPVIAASSQKYTFTVHAIDSSDTAWAIFGETLGSDVVPLAQSGSSSGIVFGYTLNALYKDGNAAFSGSRNDLYNAYTSAGQSLTTIDFSGDGVGVLFNRTSFQMNGTAQEIVIYASDQSSNRTGIESNINTYYSIYP